MRVRLSTVQFAGPGHIDCRKCERRSTFPDGASLIVFDYGDIQIIRSANSRAILHQCGQEFFWQCATCGAEPTFEIRPKYLRGRRKRVLRCTCGGSFEQFRAAQAIEVPDLAATPF